jgi:hypothetical protein
VSEIIDVNGDGSGNLLVAPTAIAVDGAGNVFVGGQDSSTVFRVTPAGAKSLVLDPSGDGAGNPLDEPEALAADAFGAVYAVGFTSDNAFRVDLAFATSRNAGTNPESYSATPPVLGSTFTGTVDLTTTGHAFALVVGYLSSLNLTLSGGQVVLVNVADPVGEVLGFSIDAGPTAVFQATVPNDGALCGIRVYTQAIHVGGVIPFALSNAIDATVGTP